MNMQINIELLNEKETWNLLNRIADLKCFSPRDREAEYSCREYDRAAFTNENNCPRCELIDMLNKAHMRKRLDPI